MFVFKIDSLSTIEDASSEEESSDGDEMGTNKYLFYCEVPMGQNIVLRLFISAAHNHEYFGKLFFQISKDERVIDFRNYRPVIEFFTMRSKDKIKSFGRHGLWATDNVQFRIEDNGNLTLYSYSIISCRDTIIMHLTKNELKTIARFIWGISEVKLQEFEKFELVTGEAINDILAECRMAAQGDCRACKEIGTQNHHHRCDIMLVRRLHRVIKSALSTRDKWPCSEAIRQIYETLAPHIVYFKERFRHSMSWNKHVTTTYKTDELPGYVRFDK